MDENEDEDNYLFWARVNNVEIPVFAREIADVFAALPDVTKVREDHRVMTTPNFSFGVTHCVDILVSDSGKSYATSSSRRGDQLPHAKSWEVLHTNVLVAYPREWKTQSIPLDCYGR